MTATRYRLKWVVGANYSAASYGSGQYGTQTYGQEASDPLASLFYVPMPWPGGTPTVPSWMYRQGDTSPDFDVQIRSQLGPMSLAPVGGGWLVLSSYETDLVLAFALTVTDEPRGRIGREWQAGDLDTLGAFRATVVLLFDSGRQLTVPATDRHRFVVHSMDPTAMVVP